MSRPYARTITLTLDTSAYGSADLVADTQEMADAFDLDGGSAFLESVTLIDKDDQTASAYTLVFLNQSVSLGTENSAPNVSDANAAAAVIGAIGIASGDWVDMGGQKVASKGNLGLVLQVATGKSLFVALVNGAGTPTFTAAGLVLVLGFRAA